MKLYFPMVMNTFLCSVVLILFNIDSQVWSSNKFSSPLTWEFRKFASWDFKGFLNDSCNVNNLESRNNELPAKTVSKVSKMRHNVIQEDTVTKVERYLLNKTSPSSELLRDDERPEGLLELHLLATDPLSEAVCLDGSPPGIYLRNGSGNGNSKWIIFFGGGAWCHDRDSCYERSSTDIGSSKCLAPFLRLEGLLSSDALYNPDFYNWNFVFVCYCDGGSFTGYRPKPLIVNNKRLYFRGRRILDAVLDDLIRRGIDRATDIILSGQSAGALSAIIHADYIRERLRRFTQAYFRVLPDAGYFLDTPSWNGRDVIQPIFRQLYDLHNSSTGLNGACLRAQNSDSKWRCFFPEYSIPHTKSSIFVVNPLYDTWQIAYLYNVPCILKPENCSAEELSRIMDFREKTLHSLQAVLNSNETGLFADSCFSHSQTVLNDSWTKIQVGNVTMNKAFVEWYKGDTRERFRIDKPYPNNPSCPNSDSKKR